MAGSSLLMLIDDIATLLDDVAVMSKLAVKKTAGVLGDDLALNAEQVTGVKPDRELPVVWAVAKGSFVNKAILVPSVYGLVGGIVKLDDAGLWLAQLKGDRTWTRLKNALGRGILQAAPYLMKALSIVGTAAMFLVGGGILVHGLPPLHHFIQAGTGAAAEIPTFGSLLSSLGEIAAQGLVGVIVGGVLVGVLALVQRVRGKQSH